MSTAKKPRRFRKWVLRGILVILVLVVAATGVLCYAAKSANSRWDRLAQELRDDGQPITFAEIDALRPPIAEGDNGIGVIHTILEMLDEIEEPDDSGVVILDCECEDDFFDGIPGDCVPPTRAYVEARRAALDELGKLASYPTARFDLSYEGNPADVVSMMLPEVSGLRQLGKLISVDIILKTIDGDTAGASAMVPLQLRLSESLANEPNLIQHLVGIATGALAKNTTETLLRCHELTAKDLAVLQHAWERHIAAQTMKWALLGERVLFVRLTDAKCVLNEFAASPGATGTKPRQQPSGRESIRRTVFSLGDWFLLENRVRGVPVLSRLIAASDNSFELLTAAKREQAAQPNIRWPWNMMTKTTLPGVIRSIELHAMAVGQSRAALVALAAERFRIANGRFPASAGELTPEFISEIPRDPFDNQPIRLVHTEDGLVAYSIGQNLTDDGGRVVPPEGERHPPDIGFRLMHPHLRGVVLLESPATDEEHASDE